MTATARQTRGERMRGVTLVELMVALLIGALLTGIAVKVFSSSLDVQRTTEAFSRIQQNARFADILLSRDLRQADSFGCTNRDNLNSIVDPTNGGGPNVDLSGPAVTGSEDPGGASINDSDTITLRGTGNLNATITNDPGAGSQMFLSSVQGLAIGDLVMVTDCSGQAAGGATTTEVFQATNVVQANGNVVHAVGGAAPGNTAPPSLNNTYPNGTAMTVRQAVYRVASGDTGAPTLQASYNGRAFQDLISDVYSMQIVYGEDTNADDVANRYVAANQVGNMDNVVAVRIQLMVMGGLPNVARTGWVDNADMDGNGNQQITYDAEFGGTTETLPDGQLGELVTITSALRGRLP